MKKICLWLVPMLMIFMLLSCGEDKRIIKEESGPSDLDSDKTDSEILEDEDLVDNEPDNEVSDDETIVCKDEKTECRDNFVYKCVDNAWEKWDDCTYEQKICTVKDGVAQCLGDNGNDEDDEVNDMDTDDSGDSGDTGDTGNTGNTGDTGDTGDTGNDWEDHACYESDGDADSDGIKNSVECPEFPCMDSDGDALPDCLDADSDGDTISDSTECPTQPCIDTDSDGTPNFLDKDSDNDGIKDRKERELGLDNLKKDTDSDGDEDLVEMVYGSDPLDDSDKIPDGVYYIVLPYGAPEKTIESLEFTTDIKKVDIAILLDLSGSMTEEQANLREKIKTDVIDKVKTINEGTLDAAYSLVHFMDFDNDMSKVYNVDQYVTTNENLMKTALDSTPEVYGGTECHWLVLYAATTEDDIVGPCSVVPSIPFNNVTCNIPSPDCSGKEGSRGGLCFRKQAMPILIMITDEDFGDNKLPPINENASNLAQQSLMDQNAKFIGIDSSSTNGSSEIADKYETVAQVTGTLDNLGNSFNFAVGPDAVAGDGSPMSEKIGDAIESLTIYVQMDVWLKGGSELDCNGTNTGQFVISGIPIEADPADGVGIDIADMKFTDVDPGTVVTFDAVFKNDFCINPSEEPLIFIVDLFALGDGASLSKHEVNVIIPTSDNNW